jgi:hypothetical protein
MSATAAQIDQRQAQAPSEPAPRDATAGGGGRGGDGGGGGASENREPAYGAHVVMAGLLAMVTVFVVAVLRYKTAADVATSVGAVSAVVAALVGAYFGIRGATLAQKTNAESSAGSQQG